MEKVLDIYKQILDPGHPVMCMDESPRQLISERQKFPFYRHREDQPGTTMNIGETVCAIFSLPASPWRESV